MNIVQLVASIEEEASGPSYTVPSLARGLAMLDHDVTLMSLAQRADKKAEGKLTHVKYPYAQSGFSNRLGRAPEMKVGLHSQLGHADIFHAQGLWQMPSVYPAQLIGKNQTPKFVITTRGMLGPGALQFSKMKKKLFWKLWQKQAVRAADCLHATSAVSYTHLTLPTTPYV